MFRLHLNKYIWPQRESIMHHCILDKTEGVLSHFKDDFIAQRMMSMGVLPGAKVKLIRANPRIGAYYILASNRHFAMRKEEAESLIIV